MAGDAHFESLGLHPRVRLELGSNEAVKQAVAQGKRLSPLANAFLDHLQVLASQWEVHS